MKVKKLIKLQKTIQKLFNHEKHLDWVTCSEIKYICNQLGGRYEKILEEMGYESKNASLSYTIYGRYWPHLTPDEKLLVALFRILAIEVLIQEEIEKI